MKTRARRGVGGQGGGGGFGVQVQRFLRLDRQCRHGQNAERQRRTCARGLSNRKRRFAERRRGPRMARGWHSWIPTLVLRGGELGRRI